MKKTTLAVLAALSCAACSSAPRRVIDGQLPQSFDQRQDHRGYLEAVGIGAADPALPTLTQRQALARDAAVVKAQYELLSLVKGVALEGGVTVERALETDSRLEARVQDTIKGAEIVRTEYTKDDGCVVTMRLPKARLEKLMGVSFE